MTASQTIELDFSAARLLPAVARAPQQRDFLRDRRVIGAVWPSREVGPRHWLIESLCGKELLVARLRQRRPDLRIARGRVYRGDLSLLEAIVDDLGLRDMPPPVGWRAQWQFFVRCAAMQWKLELHPAQPWQACDGQ